MKKLLYTIAILAAAAISASCTKDAAGFSAVSGEQQGAATINIGVGGLTRALLSADTYPGTDTDIRIYNSSRELVRYYTDLNDLPSEIWMTEGDYTLDVTLGVRETPTFEHPYFHGSASFDIRKGQTSDVNVNCTVQNTIIKINFDKSIAKNFDSYDVKVVAGESFGNGSSALLFDENNIGRYGYLILPEGQNKISFRFEGELDDNAGKVSRTYEGIALESDKIKGYCHEINVKYTASAPSDENGYLSWNIRVTVAAEEVFDDVLEVNPAPRPTIGGSDWDMSEPKRVTSEGVSYNISSAGGEIKFVTVACNGGEALRVECETEGDKGNGITVRYAAESELTRAESEADARNIILTLGEEFFNTAVSGGEQKIRIRAYTGENVFGECVSKVITQGAYAVTPATAALDRWQGKGEFSAYVFDGSSASKIEIKYRKKETEDWTTATATAAGDEIYKIYDAAVNADTEYEYQLLVDDKEVGAVKSEKTENGPQIPNGGFEDWSMSGSAHNPYLAGGYQFWDTGNAGSANYGVVISKKNQNDHPAESQGTTSAALTSKYAVIKLAAGNIFVGKFLELDGIDGVVAFGKPFDYTFRPKALKFWYKGKIGKINRVKNTPPNGAKKDDPDCANVYVCLTNMGGPHIVNTSKPETYMSFAEPLKTISYCTNVDGKRSTNDQTDGKVIAYYSWDCYDSTDEWTEVTLNLIYNEEEYEDEDDMPNYLMITASANKYGDYYTGCDSNEFYIDDVEFVY